MADDLSIEKKATSTQPNEPSIVEEHTDPEVQKHIKASDVDAALEYLNREGTAALTELDERKLVRKIDWRIVPLMCMSGNPTASHRPILTLTYGNIVALVYTSQYLDKTLVNYANVMGLQSDAHLVGNQFSYLALIFYVTYLAFEFPTGYLMQRLPTAKYLGANVALWGVIITRRQLLELTPFPSPSSTGVFNKRHASWAFM
jgi:hypothetical protein